MTFVSVTQFHVFLPWGQHPIVDAFSVIVQLHRIIVYSTSPWSAALQRCSDGWAAVRWPAQPSRHQAQRAAGCRGRGDLLQLMLRPHSTFKCWEASNILLNDERSTLSSHYHWPRQKIKWRHIMETLCGPTLSLSYAERYETKIRKDAFAFTLKMFVGEHNAFFKW